MIGKAKTETIITWVIGVLAIALVGYGLIYGMLTRLPWQKPILGHSARNLFYHVPMWFGMMAMCGISLVYSILYLSKGDEKWDHAAAQSANVGMVYGILGLITGIIWSRVTWSRAMADWEFGAWWPWDPKQVMALIAVLIYAAYFILRNSFEDPRQRGRVSAVYNLFGAASIIPLFFIIPKILGGLHPGSADENSTVIETTIEFTRVFWPSVLGFILLGVWIFRQRWKMATIEDKLLELEE